MSSTLNARLLYGFAAALALAQLVVLWLALHPVVAPDYAAYFLDRTTTCLNQQLVPGTYVLGETVSFTSKNYGPGKEWILAFNPMLTVVISFQRFIYNPNFDDVHEAAVLPVDHHFGWYATHLGIALGISLLLLYGALALFSRLEDNFAEEI